MIKITTVFIEDTSEHKFADKEQISLMKQIDPVTLRIQRTDETTMKAVQLFAREVVILLHTCNDSEYWAALERLKPPTQGDGDKIQDSQHIIFILSHSLLQEFDLFPLIFRIFLKKKWLDLFKCLA